MSQWGSAKSLETETLSKLINLDKVLAHFAKYP